MTGHKSNFELDRTLVNGSMELWPCSDASVLYKKGWITEQEITSCASRFEQDRSTDGTLDHLTSFDAINKPAPFAALHESPNSRNSDLQGLVIVDKIATSMQLNRPVTYLDTAIVESQKRHLPEKISFASVVCSGPSVAAKKYARTAEMSDSMPKASFDSAEMRLAIVPRPRTVPARPPFPPAPTPSPVVITTAVIDSLRGLPLPHAARSIGVSATAFKRACRRLGVNRWQYARGPRRAGGGHSASSPKTRAGGSDSAIFSARPLMAKLPENAGAAGMPGTPRTDPTDAGPGPISRPSHCPFSAPAGPGAAADIRVFVEGGSGSSEPSSSAAPPHPPSSPAEKAGTGSCRSRAGDGNWAAAGAAAAALPAFSAGEDAGWGDAAEDSDDSLVLLLLLSQPWR